MLTTLYQTNMSVNATEVSLKEAVELLLKRGNDLFHCPVAAPAVKGHKEVQPKTNLEVTEDLELKHDAEKIDTDDEQFELL